MLTFHWKNWFARLVRFMPRSVRQPRPATRPVRRSHLELEELEDRTLPAASLLNAATVMMKPTYQLLQARTPAVQPADAPAGFGPAQIRTAYGFNNITLPGNVPANGAGQTIAIVDAYDDPTAALDLTAFDGQYGLVDPNFIKVGINAQGQASTSSFPSPDPDWSIEIGLDVEWAHAIAPAASILLVEANSNSYSDLLAGVNYARNYPGVVTVSMSWGGSEFSGETAFDSYFTTPAGHNGVTFFASSGDAGAPAEVPSISSHVVSVGGTSLTLNGSGDWSAETGWSGSGGGISAYVSQPSYQNNLSIFGEDAGGMRATPDVSYDADPNTGVAVLSTYGYGGWLQVGGTSAASPQWAALLAIADQGRALAGEGSLDGFTQTLPDLYALPSLDFHDITAGNNGYPAGPGYDLVTGLGSPVANFIVPDLLDITTTQVPTSLIVTPSNPVIYDGSQEQLSAIVLDQIGRPMANQPSSAWSMVNGQGTVDDNGLYTAPSTGTGTDTVEASATLDGISLSATDSVGYAQGLTITSIGASPSTVTGTTTTVSATAANIGGDYAFYFWYGLYLPAGGVEPLFDNPDSPTTTATFFGPGTYTLSFMAIDGLGDLASATVNVTVVSTLTSVEVSPLVTNVPDGSQQQYTAQAYDQFYNPMPSTFAWSIANGGGSVDANGLFTAPATGSGTTYVQATSTVNGVSGQGYAILVQPPVVTSISAAANPVNGVSTNLTVNAYDPQGENLSFLWSVTAQPAGAPAPTLTAANNWTTSAKFFQAGSYTFQVAVTNDTGVTTLANVNVTVNSVLTSVAVTPLKATVADGSQQQFSAMAFDQFKQPMAATISWSVTSGPGSVNGASGLYTTPATGTGTPIIKASASMNNVTMSSTASVTLLPPPAITSISASPSPVTGTTTTLKVAASNSTGGNLSYQWKVTGQPAGAKTPTIANAATAAATATFFQAGAYAFQVTVSNQLGQMTQATVNVTVNSVLTSVSVSPTSATLSGGSQDQFTVKALDQFQQMVAPTMKWSLVSGAGSINSSTGLYTGPSSGNGTTVVRGSATLGGITLSGTASVTFVPAPTISSISATSVTGTAAALKVVASDAGGNLSCSWSVLTQPAGAPAPTFSAGNASTTSATFFQAGTYGFQVTVTNQFGKTALAKVSVTVNAVLTSVVVTPATATVPHGSQQQFSAVALDQFGNAMAKPSIAWSVSGLGSINSSGLYTGPASATGSATIKAKVTVNGIGLTGTANVNVT